MGKNDIDRIDHFGLSEKEKEMHLHNYNHALFRNMVFFMDAVWEINMITGTMVSLRDKTDPNDDVREQVYQDVYQEYLTKKVLKEEQELFEGHMAMENLEKLEDEISFDIKLRQRHGGWDLHRIVLTPAFDSEGKLYCVYFGSRNLQMEVARELAEYHNQEQFRDALIVNCFFHVDYDLDGDGLLRRDFLTRDGVGLISQVTGKELPVAFDEFIQKWYELHDPHFDGQDGEKIFSAAYLKQLYADHKRLINMEVKQKVCAGDSMPESLQIFIILMEDIESGHIHANIIWRDVSSFHKKAVEDNRELESSNRMLQRTIRQEQQFRQSVLFGAILIYEINLTKNRIEEEFYETVDGKQYPMLELMGLTAPCSFDEFGRRWSEQKVSEESRETFLRIYNRNYMLDAYERGERQLELEFDTVLARGIPMTLRSTALLVEDAESGDIIAMVNSKDVTAQRKEEFKQREILKAAYEAAHRTSVAKTDFLVRISHDIRTPMNAIIGMTAIAQRHQDNIERVDDCLKRISMSGKYLLGLVDEMLDLSMIESGKMEFTESEIDLEEQFENLGILLQMQMNEKGQEFVGILEPLKHTKAYGDRRRMDQVIMNLVDNAIKYTPAGGSISLTLREIPTNSTGLGCYEIVVEDNGIGMTPELAQQAFEPFVRAKDRRVEMVQGSGLGLTITRNIVYMMDGSIHIESEPEKGTKVTARIFLKLTDGATGDSAEKDMEGKAAVDSFSELDFTGHRALIVEDNESNAEIFQEILKMVGFETEHQWNGKDAVDTMALVEEGYYDIVFMDIIMPVMDGYTATKEIRKQNRSYAKEVPIVAMSANAYEEDIEASKAAGMNDYLVKPVDLMHLKNVLCEYIRK